MADEDVPRLIGHRADRTEKQDELLEHVEQMVRYWASEPPSNVPAETSKLDALSGLAFSMLVMFDGGAAVGPYAVVPLDDDGKPILDVSGGTVNVMDLAGELHERQKEIAERMAEARKEAG